MIQHLFAFALFAGLIGFLVFLQVKHWVSFDSKLQGNHPGEPLPTRFPAKHLSQENGSVLASTPGAKAMAALMAICLAGLFVILLSILKLGLFTMIS